MGRSGCLTLAQTWCVELKRDTIRMSQKNIPELEAIQTWTVDCYYTARRFVLLPMTSVHGLHAAEHVAFLNKTRQFCLFAMFKNRHLSNSYKISYNFLKHYKII